MKRSNGDLVNTRPITLLLKIYKWFSKTVTKGLQNTWDENKPHKRVSFRSKITNDP